MGVFTASILAQITETSRESTHHFSIFTFLVPESQKSEVSSPNAFKSLRQAMTLSLSYVANEVVSLFLLIRNGEGSM